MNRIYLVRHGENTANLTKEFSHRRVDYSLTPKGILQAHGGFMAAENRPDGGTMISLSVPIQ